MQSSLELYSLNDAITSQGGLTPNLWFMIFSQLDVISLLKAAEVCQLWQSWSRNDRSWTKHEASENFFFFLKFLKLL